MPEMTEEKIQKVLQHPMVTAERLKICEQVLAGTTFHYLEQAHGLPRGRCRAMFMTTMRWVALTMLSSTFARQTYYCTSAEEYRSRRRLPYWTHVVSVLVTRTTAASPETTADL